MDSRTMSYDLAGNLINDTYTGVGAREYDAEKATEVDSLSDWPFNFGQL
jgi:hypothetical protein